MHDVTISFLYSMAFVLIDTYSS